MNRIKYFLFIFLLICSTGKEASAAAFGIGTGFWFIDWQEQTITGLQEEAADSDPFSIENNKSIIAGVHLSYQSENGKTALNTKFYFLNAIETIHDYTDTSMGSFKVRPGRMDFSCIATRNIQDIFQIHWGILYSKYRLWSNRMNFAKSYRIEPQAGAGIRVRFFRKFEIKCGLHVTVPVSNNRYPFSDSPASSSTIAIGYISEIKISYSPDGMSRFTIGYRDSRSSKPVGTSLPAGKSSTSGITFAVVYWMNFYKKDLYPAKDWHITFAEDDSIESYVTSSHW